MKLDFQKGEGLMPAIIQDSETKEVLMLGYMNEVAWQRTHETGLVHFWSRSRNNIWLKGETSGNMLMVESYKVDCDGDTVLIEVQLKGDCVCHTGSHSCFTSQRTKGIL